MAGNIILGFALGFLIIRLVIVWINLLTRPFLKIGNLTTYPVLSILIPARNEANNLATLFQQLAKVDYPNVEFIVLNDESADQTEYILQQELENLPTGRYVNGEPLPKGWLGKNWACHQLAVEAQGDYFLYLDADVSHIAPGVIESALHKMQRLDLSLLSIFPDQDLRSFGEKIVVPLMHYLLLSLLPLWAIYRFRYPYLAAANGQFMLFEAKTYRKQRWHQRVKGDIVEDIAIMREIKRSHLTGMAFLADGMISTRMYTGWSESISGFSKNLLAGFGNSAMRLVVYLFMIIGVWVLGGYGMWEKMGWQGIEIILILILMIRVGISLLSRQSIWVNLLLHPFQMGMLVVIGILSIYKRVIGKILWKGRNVFS